MTAPHRLAELLAELDPARLSAVISLLPVEVLLPVKVGLDVALGRADHQFDELLGADYPGGRFHRQHPLVYATRLQKARWPPNGDRAAWIAYGPAGKPHHPDEKAA